MSGGASSTLPNVRGGGGDIHEILFAQRLADNELRIRNKALKKLTNYIVLKSSNGPGFSDDDALKLWKGLFYCMYNSDKPLVQEELAERISHLIHEIGNLIDCRTFTNAAFQTFAREWDGIDIFRIDKYMMFIRRFLRQVLVHLKLLNWNMKELNSYMKILDTTIVRADDDTNTVPLGIKLHLVSIILEEVAKIGGEELEHDVLVAFLKPFMKVLAITKIKRYREAVTDDIMHHLMAQSDAGVAYEDMAEKVVHSTDNRKLQAQLYALQEEAEAGEEEEEDEEEETMEVPIDEAVLDPRAGKVDVHIPQLRPNFGKLADALQSVGSLKKIAKDNRRHLYSLIKKFRDMAKDDYPLKLPDIAFERVEYYANHKIREKEAIKDLQGFYKNLKNLTNADITEMKDLETRDPLKNLCVSSMIKGASKKKLRKLKRLRRRQKNVNKKKVSLSVKKRLSRQAVSASVNRLHAVEDRLNQLDKLVSSKDKIVKNGVKSKDKDIFKATDGFQVSDISSPAAEGKPKSASAISSFEVTEIPTKADDKKRKVQADSGKKSKKVKAPLEEKKVSSINENESTKKSSKKNKKNKVKENKSNEAKLESGPENGKTQSAKSSNEFEVPDFICDTESSLSQKVPVSANKELEASSKKDKKKEKKKNKKAKETGDMNANSSQESHVGSGSPVLATPPENIDLDITKLKTPTKETPKKSKEESVTKSLKKKKKSKKEKDIEIFLKETREMVVKNKKNASIDSQKGTPKTPMGKPKTPKLQTPRSIKINLKKNKEHDFKDYAHSIRNSPQIPFSADKVPKAPVLKPSPSPILVSKSGLKILKNNLRKSPSSASPLLKKKKTPKAKKMRSLAADFF